VSRDLPCPNPGCKYVFPAAEAVGVAALICPECGGVFQVKARQAPDRESVVETRTGVRPSSNVGKHDGRPIVWVVAGLLVLVSLVLGLATVYRVKAPRAGVPEVYRSAEHNYSVRLPGPPWQRDDDLAKRLGGVLAFRREHPEADVVLAVRELSTTLPTPGELRDAALARLRQYPVNDLRFEDKSGGVAFGGKPAGRIVFQGEMRDTPVSGDVHYLAHQGGAYWFYRWCPAVDVHKTAGDLADLAGRFTALDLRPDWRPMQRTLGGSKLNYTLTAEGDRWHKAPYPPENYDPAADLALVGQARSDATPQAQLLVLLLPPDGGAPVERAKSHVLARQKEVYPETALAELSDAAITRSDDTLVLRVDNTKERARFMVLRVMPLPSRLVVVCAECDYAKRDLWENDLGKLVASFKSGD